MANIIAFKDFYAYTIDSQSSEQANYPASDLLFPDQQLSYWKTNVATDSWVILDLGSAQAVTSVALINTNYTTVNIQGDTTTSFASPATDSGTLTTQIDLARGRRYLHTDPSTYAPAFNHRYLRVFIPTQTPTDGASVFKTGGVIVKTGTNTLLFNPEQGLNIVINRASDVVELASGRREVRNISERLATMSCDFRRDVRVEAQVDELQNLFVTIDENDLIFLYDNGNLLTKPVDSPSMYVFRKVGGSSMSYDNYSTFNLSGITLLEQI